MTLKPLTKAEKAAWLRDLRSGEFLQGKMALCAARDARTRWCCLGVGANAIVDGWWEWDEHFRWWALTTRGNSSDTSVALIDRIGSQRVGTLIEMNDRGDSFAAIADWIEANIPPLEVTP